MIRSTVVRRAGVATLAVAFGVFGLASVAFAHVTVSPSTAEQGGEAVVTFRVPTESDTASTTTVQVFFDMTHPLAVVDIQQVPGWTAVAHTATLTTPIKDDDGNTVNSAVSDVTWTADSATTAIRPGQFQQFPIEIGPLPTAASYTFKVLQTYSDKSVVHWIDTSTPGQPEPDHPAPVLTLTAAGGEAGGATAATPAPEQTSASGTATTSSGSGRTWGIVGALLGLIGAVLGGAAYARIRATAPAGTPVTKADSAEK